MDSKSLYKVASHTTIRLITSAHNVIILCECPLYIYIIIAIAHAKCTEYAPLSDLLTQYDTLTSHTLNSVLSMLYVLTTETHKIIMY